jgi:DNA-binding CsgD family transcriptional regulator
MNFAMCTLNKNDYHDAINLLDRCIACLKNDAKIEGVLFEILKSFKADDIVFLSANNSENGVDLANSYVLRRDRAFLNQYADYFWRYDPLYHMQFYNNTKNPVFKTDDVIPYSQMIKLDYYNLFLRPQNLLGELIIRLYSEDRVFGAISLQRLKEHPNFSKKDTLKALLLVPYLNNIFETANRFLRNNEERMLLEQWMESYSEGMILLDSEFKPLYLNSKAKQFCLLMNGMREQALNEDNSVDTSIPRIVIQDCMDMKTLQNNSNSFKGHSNRIINIRPNKRYYLQYFSTFWSTKKLPVPRFIVFLNELSKYGTGIEEFLNTEEKLSEREEVVAQYVAIGLSNKQIADKLCLSSFTVQNHLKSIFEKTGLDSRAKLANLLKYSDDILS